MTQTDYEMNDSQKALLQEKKPVRGFKIPVGGPYRTLQGKPIPKKQVGKYKTGKRSLPK
jgi:hypothetical protein